MAGFYFVGVVILAICAGKEFGTVKGFYLVGASLVAYAIVGSVTKYLDGNKRK